MYGVDYTGGSSPELQVNDGYSGTLGVTYAMTDATQQDYRFDNVDAAGIGALGTWLWGDDITWANAAGAADLDHPIALILPQNNVVCNVYTPGCVNQRTCTALTTPRALALMASAIRMTLPIRQLFYLRRHFGLYRHVPCGMTTPRCLFASASEKRARCSKILLTPTGNRHSLWTRRRARRSDKLVGLDVDEGP